MNKLWWIGNIFSVWRETVLFPVNDVTDFNVNAQNPKWNQTKKKKSYVKIIEKLDQSKSGELWLKKNLKRNFAASSSWLDTYNVFIVTFSDFPDERTKTYGTFDVQIRNDGVRFLLDGRWRKSNNKNKKNWNPRPSDGTAREIPYPC